jgi:putative spermidine/putrescine transport system substrate-binding protein
MPITKRLFASVVLAAGAASVAHAEQLVVNSYGGPYEQIIMERIIEPFQKMTGISVVYDSVGSASQDYAKIKATRGRPGFDVVVMTASQSLDGCREGLLEKFSAKTVPNLAKLSPAINKIAGECGAVHELQYMSLMWRTDKIKSAPTSWSLLFQPELKGKVILPTFQNIMAANLVQALSVMNGGDLLENVAPGFTAMGKLAKQTVGFEQSSAVMETYIKDGQVWAMPFWNGRAQLLMDSGLPVDYTRPKEGTIPLIATLNVPAGAENKAAAMKFVDFFLEKSSQEAWVTGYKVGSARPDIEVPDSVRARQITTEEDLKKLLLPDLSITAAKLPEWGDRWERDVVHAAN